MHIFRVIVVVILTVVLPLTGKHRTRIAFQ